MKEFLSMYDKGNVSLYFLTVFSLVTVWTGVIAANVGERMQAMDNMVMANRYLNQENAVICDLKCRLKNQAADEGSYLSSGVSYSLSCTEGSCTVLVGSPLPEQLLIEIRDGIIYDYVSYR